MSDLKPKPLDEKLGSEPCVLLERPAGQPHAHVSGLVSVPGVVGRCLVSSPRVFL